METTEKLLDVKEVAGMLDMHPNTVKGLIRDGQLTAYDLPNGYRFKKAWIEDFLNRQTLNPELIAGGN